jgi:predicted GIY-YIG superfamily endonuclease
MRLRAIDPDAPCTRLATDEESPRFAPATALYRFFDAGQQLLYVGVSGQPGERWARHRRESPWWRTAMFVAVEILPSMHAALDAEREAIQSETPAFNKRSKGGEV